MQRRCRLRRACGGDAGSVEQCGGDAGSVEHNGLNAGVVRHGGVGSRASSGTAASVPASSGTAASDSFCGIVRHGGVGAGIVEHQPWNLHSRTWQFNLVLGIQLSPFWRKQLREHPGAAFIDLKFVSRWVFERAIAPLNVGGFRTGCFRNFWNGREYAGRCDESDIRLITLNQSPGCALAALGWVRFAWVFECYERPKQCFEFRGDSVLDPERRPKPLNQRHSIRLDFDTGAGQLRLAAADS